MKKEDNQIKEEGNKFYYDDSNFNSFIKKDKKKLKKIICGSLIIFIP